MVIRQGSPDDEVLREGAEEQGHDGSREKTL